MHWECQQVGEHWMNCSEFAPGSVPIIETVTDNTRQIRLHELWSRTWRNFLGVYDDPLSQHTDSVLPDTEDVSRGLVLIRGPHGLYESGVNGTAFRKMYRCDVNLRDMNGFWKKASIIGELGYISLILVVAAFSIGQATLWWVVTKLAHNLYLELQS